MRVCLKKPLELLGITIPKHETGSLLWITWGPPRGEFLYHVKFPGKDMIDIPSGLVDFDVRDTI